jgi:hypothetical protein
MCQGLMGYVRLLAATLLTVPPLVVAASIDPASLAGIWKGTIGRQPVVACFNRADADEEEGSYYYLKHLVPISVGYQASTQTLKEADGVWDVDLVPGSDTLGGTWKKTKDATSVVPIALTRVGAADPKACGSDAFIAPLEAPSAPRVVTGPRIDYQGHGYRELSGLNQATMQILVPGAAVDAINRDLRAVIDDSPKAVSEYNARRRENLATRGYVMDDENNVSPSFWSDRYVSINFYSWAAGTGKNGISSDDLTWDLATGKRIDLWSWFGVKRDRPADNSAIMPARLLAHFAKPGDASSADDNCAANYTGEVSFRISLTATGMEFNQWANGDGCDLGFSADFKTLLSYMTAEGRAAVQAILDSKK